MVFTLLPAYKTSRKLALCLTVIGALEGTSALSQQSLGLEAMIQQAGLTQAPSKAADLTIAAVKRYAIVIGNSEYDNAPDLKNSVADAALVADFMRDQGYVTHEYQNVTKLEFEGILRRVLFDVDKDTEVVFYFAGHGVQIGSQNYIVPVNAALDNTYDLPFEAISLQSVVSIIGARARSQVMILDSCRNNPFAGKMLVNGLDKTEREPQNGFAIQAAPVNSLLAFSTSPGGIALDGEGSNSPYTSAFVNIASRNPQLTIGGVLEKVRQELYVRTKGFQIPWESSTLVKPLYFNPKTVFNVAMADPKPFSENTATRSLALLSVSIPKIFGTKKEEQVEETAPLVETSLPISLSAPMEDEIQIGNALRSKIGNLPAGEVEVIRPPRKGVLTLASSGTLQVPLGFALVGDNQVDDLVYVGNATQVRAIDVVQAVVTDEFTVKTAQGEQRVQLQLTPNDCDMQAGDYLDPDGVGLARYPNEIEPEKALAACAQAVSDDPKNGRFHYQLGRAQLALRQFDDAQRSFERAQELGHSRAWYALGDLEANRKGGNTGKQAPARALALYAMGVKEGDPYAFYALGREWMRYETEFTKQRDGYNLMMRALEVGHTFAMNELGYFFLDKDTQFYDPKRGLRYLQESASRQDIYGYNNMGLVYQRGLGGTKPNYVLAQEWYLKASNGGHPNAPTNLGRMYFEGQIGGKPDMGKAVEWYDKGLERGDAWAGANAAWILANKKVAGMTRYDAAVRAAKAAELPNDKAQEAAIKVLKSLPKKTISGASQQFLNQFGANLEVDGAFGAGSKAALTRIASENGLEIPKAPIARLRALAQLHWQKSKFRVDLY